MISKAHPSSNNGVTSNTFAGTLSLYVLTLVAVIPAGLSIGWLAGTNAAFEAAPYLVAVVVAVMYFARFSPQLSGILDWTVCLLTVRRVALLLSGSFCIVLLFACFSVLSHRPRLLNLSAHAPTPIPIKKFPSPEGEKENFKKELAILLERYQREEALKAGAEQAPPKVHEVVHGVVPVGKSIEEIIGNRLSPLEAGAAYVPLADGFDFPVGKPDGVGYHEARSFKINGHLGDDWNGDGVGKSDLGDPVYSIGAGIVVLAENMHMGWGNVVMVRHCFRESADGGAIHTIDSLYAHVDQMLVHQGQVVSRGQQIATMGTAFGLYPAHLHFEVRRNINIGMYRSQFARDYSNYYNPKDFIETHRHLPLKSEALVAVKTFVPTLETGLRTEKEAYKAGIRFSPTEVAQVKPSPSDLHTDDPRQKP